ncbi:MAG: hypothetical protein ACXWDM_12065 [Nocardioides sp.]
MPMPLDQLSLRRSGPIPPIRETLEQSATWDTVGQSCTIVLADGGTMRETLTTVDGPRSFGYDLAARSAHGRCRSSGGSGTPTPARPSPSSRPT